ncbi:MAG: hypothetical protein HIU82_03330 [Proteobacteria bacterium]|nr:hypothetical protein [Pseudomonadota bacterium]
MSNDPVPDAPERDDPDRDLLAGEYVLGTLSPAERAAAAALAVLDPAFARIVAAWERRLMPLAELAQATPPPAELWARIESALDAAPLAAPAATLAAAGPGPAVAAGTTTRRPTESAAVRRARRSIRIWRASTAGALALAAALAGLIVLRTAPPGSLAVLAPRDGGPPLLALGTRPGELMIRPAGTLAAVPPGREMELWALPQGAHQPRPLGALPPAGRRLAVPLRPGTEIMVSLEPAGGSPTGLPTGPVLYAGRLERI